MITASHNPPEYNGIKLINPDGSSFGMAQQEHIEHLVLQDKAEAASWPDIQRCALFPEAVQRHIERILQDFRGEYRVRVVVDGGGGAASEVTPELLRRMGCEVIAINCSPTGFFPRPVEPVEENLGGLMQRVVEAGAGIGIAHDGDADRLMLVDDRGRFVSGDRLLVLFARAAGAREVITTVDASMIIEEAGLDVIHTRVGDTAVSEELIRRGEFGGEPSGSWIFPRISLCPDAIYAAAAAVSITSEGRLSQMLDAIPSYPLIRGSVALNGGMPSDLESRLLSLMPLSTSNSDGLKLHFADGWMLVRASGTEPKVRLTVEAKTEERAQQIYNAGMALISSARQGGTN
jgi:phosphoglucosamine mutase